MTINRPGDFYAVLAIIVAFGSIATDTAFGTQLTTLFGPLTPKVLAAISLLSGAAGIILRTQSNPSPPPGYASLVTPSKEATVTVANPPPAAPAA